MMLECWDRIFPIPDPTDQEIIITVAAVLRQRGASVISVLPGSSVAEAAGIITRRRIGAVVVCDEGGHLVGILSERDVVRGMART